MRNTYVVLFLVFAIVATLCISGSGQTVEVMHSWSSQAVDPAGPLCKGPDGAFYGVSTRSGSGVGDGTVFRISPEGNYSVIHSFRYADGYRPEAGLTDGKDGWMYGTTASGSTNHEGTFYKINPEGEFVVLASFFGKLVSRVQGELLLGKDGNFYGVSSAGGTNHLGAIFKATPAGEITIVHSFTAATGTEPWGRLVQGPDGTMYGTAPRGGENDRGTVFRVRTNGVTTAIHSFSETDGSGPLAGLTFGADGNLYGTTGDTFFRISPVGDHAPLHRFVAETGQIPRGEVVLAADGYFYGVTIRGGLDGAGLVYRIDAAGNYTPIVSLPSSGNFVNLVEGDAGVLWGTTVSGPITSSMVFKITNGNELVIVSELRPADGANPVAELTEGSDGVLFGATAREFSSSGTVFKASFEDGVATVLRSGENSVSGEVMGGVTQGADGFLYGVSSGSAVFRMTQSGDSVSVFARLPNNPGGRAPIGPLTQGLDKNFYGVTNNYFGEGSIYKVTPAGAVTTIGTFTGPNGRHPRKTLTAASDGRLYGTTEVGGANDQGTVFRVTIGGSPALETIVHFNNANGARPTGFLVPGANGEIFGTTRAGGANQGGGTFFRITAAGEHTVLASMGNQTLAAPEGAIAMGSDGNFYGVASFGGIGNLGGVYRVTPAGVLTVLHRFSENGPNKPMNGLVEGPDGYLYGTTTMGGVNGFGSLFKISRTGSITHLRHFDYKTGESPVGSLFRASDDQIYGMNQTGGMGGGGTLFRIEGHPGISDLQVDQITASTVSLKARVNPNGSVTTVEFTVAGVTYPAIEVPAGNAPVLVERAISGLAGRTTYQYSAKATNPMGVRATETKSFVTLNSVPIAVADRLHVPLGSELKLDVLAADSDPDGDELTITEVTQGAHGTVSIDGASLTYKPGESYTGTDTFTYTIADGFGGTSTATVHLENTAPVAVTDRVRVPIVGAAIQVLEGAAPDHDADGDALTISAVTHGSFGTVAINGSTIVYTPGAGYTGNDVFTYTVVDGYGGTSTASVHLENTAPVAVADHSRVPIGGATIQVLEGVGQDRDADGDALMISEVTDGAFGTVAINGAAVIYTPGVGYDGNDVFTYTISDIYGGRSTAQVTLTNAMVSVRDIAIHPRGQRLEIALLEEGIIGSDPDGDPLSISALGVPTKGVVVVEGEKVIYTAGAGYTGSDRFSYTISDGFGGMATGMVTLRNEVPQALSDEIFTNSEPVSLQPLANDSDADGDPLRIIAITPALHGTATIDASGLVTYVPGPRFFGRDSFTYTVTDENAPITATVHVRNTLPIALDGAETGTQVPSEEPGTVYAQVNLPSGQAFAGKIHGPGRRKVPAVFAGDGSVRLRVGDAAPGVEGATIASLSEPSGQVVVATLRGPAVKRSNDTILYGGIDGSELWIAAREGDSFGSARLQRIIEIDGNGAAIFFLAKLAGQGVGKANDLAVIAANEGAAARLLVREGDDVDGRLVKRITTLASGARTTAEARWRVGEGAIGVQLAFDSKAEALYTIPATAVSPEEWVEHASTEDLFVEGEGSVQRLGLPGFGPDGVAFLAYLAGDSRNAGGTLLIRVQNETATVLARAGGSVPDANGDPIPSLTFAKLSDPISGASGRTAFLATVNGPGVNASNRTGLWYADPDGTLRMLARAGDPAPGGGIWATFQSVVLPDGESSAPIFTGTLKLGGEARVTKKSNRGLWASNSMGALQLLLRTGDTVAGNEQAAVKSFLALSPARGSRGAARGYDSDQHVSASVRLQDGRQMLVHIAIP